jgi:hypothetical protein
VLYEAVVAQRTGLGICTVAYTATTDQELTLAVGDEVQLIEKVGADKIKGRVIGSATAPKDFPASCVEVCATQRTQSASLSCLQSLCTTFATEVQVGKLAHVVADAHVQYMAHT